MSDGERRRFRTGLAIAAACAAACPLWLYGSPVGSLVTFSPGQPIRAADFNANFKTLATAIDDTDNKCGTLSSLQTNAKTNLVAAVNETNGNCGTLSSLQTNAKSNLVAAVNETNANCGTLSSLQTNAKSNLVAAINELKSAGVLVVPSGTALPTSPVTGQVFFDTSNFALQIFNGTNWGLVGSHSSGLSGAPLVVTSTTFTPILAGTFSFHKVCPDTQLTLTANMVLTNNSASAVTVNGTFGVDGTFNASAQISFVLAASADLPLSWTETFPSTAGIHTIDYGIALPSGGSVTLGRPTINAIESPAVQ
jgi:hypothetical protein